MAIRGPRLEFSVAAFLLLALASLLVLAVASTNQRWSWGGDGYELKARFSQVGQLRKQAPVTIGGVTVGQVAAIDLPILTITGHYDGDQAGALSFYRDHLNRATPAARDRHFLIVGPWDHAGTRTPRKEVGGLTFGDASMLDRVAATFVTGAVSGIRTVTGMWRRAPASATPWAWLPADAQTTPRRRPALSSRANRLNAPRILKAPTGVWFSCLSQQSVPRRWLSRPQRYCGVAAKSRYTTCAAASMSASVGSSVLGWARAFMRQAFSRSAAAAQAAPARCP